MAITDSQRRQLKGLAHHLKPVVIIGQKGPTEAVINEIDQALEHHELMKVKMAGHDRDARKQIAAHLCEQLAAEAVQIIGNTLILFRQRKKDSQFKLSGK